jgi:hypothetical protein
LGDAVITRGEESKDGRPTLSGLKIVRDSIVVLVLGVDEILLLIAEEVEIPAKVVTFGSIGSEEAGDSLTLGSKTRVVTVAYEASTVLSVLVTVGVAKIIKFSLVVA